MLLHCYSYRSPDTKILLLAHCKIYWLLHCYTRTLQDIRILAVTLIYEHSPRCQRHWLLLAANRFSACSSWRLTCRYMYDKRSHLENLKSILLLQTLNHRYTLICSNRVPNFKEIHQITWVIAISKVCEKKKKIRQTLWRHIFRECLGGLSSNSKLEVSHPEGICAENLVGFWPGSVKLQIVKTVFSLLL